MAWQPAPPALIAAFERIRPPAEDGVEHKKMFGYPCCFVNGNMFMGLHQHNMLLRLDPSDRAELLEMDGASIFQPMPGRTMKEYVTVPPALLADEDELARWVDRSLGFAAQLPPKEPKQPKRRK